MADRVGKKEINHLFALFCRANGFRSPKTYSDVAGFALDYYGIGGGYMIVQIDNKGGGHSTPFGHRRYKAGEFASILRFGDRHSARHRESQSTCVAGEAVQSVRRQSRTLQGWSLGRHRGVFRTRADGITKNATPYDGGGANPREERPARVAERSSRRSRCRSGRSEIVFTSCSWTRTRMKSRRGGMTMRGRCSRMDSSTLARARRERHGVRTRDRTYLMPGSAVVSSVPEGSARLLRVSRIQAVFHIIPVGRLNDGCPRARRSISLSPVWPVSNELGPESRAGTAYVNYLDMARRILHCERASRRVVSSHRSSNGDHRDSRQAALFAWRLRISYAIEFGGVRMAHRTRQRHRQRHSES
jgi:hypothetical protein